MNILVNYLCFVLCVLSAGCILYIGDEMEMLRALLESSCATGIVVLPCYFEWKMKGFLAYGFCLAVLLCLYFKLHKLISASVSSGYFSFSLSVK